MAYDKIIPLRSRLDHCLDYVLNEEKTSLSYALAYAENPEKSRQLVTGINCEARTAYEEMRATKLRWDKKGGILGYHLIHSYAPGEVTPEEAHAAGVEFARRLLGDRYEAVVSTIWTGSTTTVTSSSIPSPLWMERSTEVTSRAILGGSGRPPML